MPSYPLCVDSATGLAIDRERGLGEALAGRDNGSGLPAGMVAVRPCDVAYSGPAGDGGRGALLVAGERALPVSGEPLVFLAAVACAPALVGRDGRVRAGGWLPDHVRLGLLEHHLDAGVIEQLVVAAVAAGRVKAGQRRRVMSLELVMRFVVAMTLMPDACYREVMARLVGLLPQVPWARPWRVPGSKVITAWRRRLGEQLLRELFWHVAGSIVDDEAALWCGLELCAVDGTLCRMPASEANRAVFGSSGTSDDSAPFPQLRAVVATARAGRAVLGAAAAGCGVGEQTLTAQMLDEHPEVFCAGRVFLVDSNFLGHQLIGKIRTAGAHLVMRIKAGITVRRLEWLPDGSYLAQLGVGNPIIVRVVEYNVSLPGTDDVSELFCLATTLTDWQTYPAEAICQVYPHRWVASETTIGENKSTITDAGPSRGPILRSGEPALVYQEFWAWLTGTQLIRRNAATAAAAAGPPTSDQVSFTGTRHEATRSWVQSLVTATTTTAALHAAAQRSARAVLADLVVTGRDRHSPRRRKYQPRFPRTATTKPTTRGPLTLTLFAPTPQHIDTS